MDYSDTTVVIPVMEEPAVEKVTKEVLNNLPKCRVIIIHKGPISINLRHRDLTVVKQTGSGKGVGMRQAAKLVKTKIMCFIDGDDTYEVKDLKKLVQHVRDGADMAIGDRLNHLDKGAMPGYIIFGNSILTITANVLYGLRLHDSQTGIRAMKKRMFDSLNLRETHFGIEEEMNIKAKKNGYRIVEMPTSYYRRDGPAKHMKISGGLKLFLINLKFLSDK
ncbi:MAG: glycosyltransferase family 2 protein [Candidatus Marsarchaeota archaeon]|nr:glycosyltransferase family 2 protein [Candidatus Marsarchaeota archaeon]